MGQGATSIEIPGGAKVVNPTPLDPKYGPYTSIADANASNPLSERYKGLTVGILIEEDCVEYWYKGGVTNEHLILKMPIISSGVSETIINHDQEGNLHLDFTNADVIYVNLGADILDLTVTCPEKNRVYRVIFIQDGTGLWLMVNDLPAELMGQAGADPDWSTAPGDIIIWDLTRITDDPKIEVISSGGLQ